MGAHVWHAICNGACAKISIINRQKSGPGKTEPAGPAPTPMLHAISPLQPLDPLSSKREHMIRNHFNHAPIF